MKTKLELADDFALKVIESGCSFELSELVSQAWEYADLMYEEDSGRKHKEVHKRIERNAIFASGLVYETE